MSCEGVRVRVCLCEGVSVCTYHSSALAGETLQASWASFPAATEKCTP